MASVFLRLGILFAIAVTNLSAQGLKDTGKEHGEGPSDHSLDPGVVLVPGPHRIVVQRKTPLLLNCSVVLTNSSLKISNYTWYKDGNLIGTSRTRTKLFKNGSISIHPKRKKSEARRWRKIDGLYECVVSLGSLGSVIASRVEVVVVSIASSFTREPSNQTVFEGGVAKFECNIKSVPRASYVWNKNNIQLPADDDRFEFLPSGVLHIRDIKASDAGQYCCQATPYLYAAIQGKNTNLRWRISREGELKVVQGSRKRAPVIVAGPKDTVAEVGQTVNLECLVDGWPQPKVIWKKKATETDREHMYEPLKMSTNLKIKSVTPAYAGTYECMVSSEGVERRASAVLNVTTPPKITTEPKSSFYPVAKNTKISCIVAGNPTVNVSWYLNGKPMSSSDVSYKLSRQSVILYTLRRENSGYYQCIANNSVGQVMALAYIKINIKDGAPGPPENVQVVAVNSTTALATWRQAPSGRPSLLHYRLVDKKSGDPGIKFCYLADTLKQRCWLPKLQPDTDYYINIQAFNAKSGSDPSENVFFKTKKDVSKKTIPVFNVENLPKFHSVNVSWQPVPDDLGQVTFYNIYYRFKDGSEEESFKVSASQTSYILSELEADAAYEVIVLAAIGKGQQLDRSEWSWKSFHTAKANASSSFMVKFVNSTSVLLQWERPATSSSQENAISGYTIALQYFGQNQPFREIVLPFTDSHVLTRLDEDVTYEVTLMARSGGGVTRVTSQAFKILDLQDPLVPDRFWAEDVDARSMQLQWSAVPYEDVTYEVCYNIEFDAASEMCRQSLVTSYNLTDVQPYSRYELRVRALQGKKKGEFSKNIIVLTGQTHPSPPVNVTVEVKSQGAVSLCWSPPEHPNGVVTSYVVQYGKEPEEPSLEIAWKKITTSGEVQATEIDELDEVKYYFKIAATTIVGLGADSEVKDIVPICPPGAKNCRTVLVVPRPGNNNENVEDTRKAGMHPFKLSAIIIGVLIGIVLILVVLFLLCRRRCAKNRAADANTAPITVCPPNGHILPLFSPSHNHPRPGNGHAHHQLDQSFTTILDHPESTTPMLQIPENEGSDSKGGNDSIVTPNGVRMNGFIRPNMWHGGQAPHHRYSGDLNLSHNSEEMQGLIKAMMASTDGRDIINGSGDTALMMSSLDDIDRGNHSQKTGDHSSEDSGTGCHRAGTNGMCNGLNSPASSPGGSSEANSSLGRRHLLADGGSWGDELGGMVMDPATGTVIGMAFPSGGTQPYDGDILKEEEEEREEEEEWAPMSGHGMAADEHVSNDRDSGHGSEIKTHSMCANSSEEEHLPALGLGVGSDPDSGSHPQVADHSCNPSSYRVREANSLPPPPPSPPRSPSSSSQQLSSSSSSSRNKHSNKLPQADRPGHRHRRTNRLHTPISKLPCPPPPPPLSALSPPPPPPHCLPEVAASATEDKLSVGKEEGMESRRSAGSGSSSSASGQSSQGADVVFSQPTATSSPPHVV